MYNLIVDKLLSNIIFFESVKYARMNFVLRSNSFMAMIASLSSCYFTALYYESFVKKRHLLENTKHLMYVFLY